MTDSELLEQVHVLEDGLVRFATGGGFEDPEYQHLRKLVIDDPPAQEACSGILEDESHSRAILELHKRAF